ncbi:MAG: alcohol dehydrogenase catalytic domain-containing protein [Actinomycetota bacterium]
MQAAHMDDGTLHIADVPVPRPGPDQALVRLTASGVCHSDLHLARGDWIGVPARGPLGHEGIGIVEALGPGAQRFVAVGDRVILGLGGAGGDYWCGACEYCLGGEPRLCNQSQALMGTFAEYVAAFAPGLVTLPETIADHEAPLACGGLTAYGAVKKLIDHHVMPGRTIAIIGAAGGLGHYAVQIARAFGYRVVGIDVGAERLAFVTSLGAAVALEADQALEVVMRDFGGVDASLIFSAQMSGFQLGFDLLRKGGLFVGVALPATSEGNIQINPFAFFAKGATLVYSAVGTVADMRDLVALVADGKVTTHVGREGPLSALDSILDELQAGAYLGRAVLTDLRG